MTNNTIPNVPRELLERLLDNPHTFRRLIVSNEELRALLSAPSPAGVDGCKCSMSISMLGDGCRHCQPQEYIDRLIEMLDEERDQQAQRIGELEGLLRHAQKQVPTGSGLHMRIDAALSAVCAAAPNIATTSEHNADLRT
jgi:hypothetical protein